jgi:hypothetical protein
MLSVRDYARLGSALSVMGCCAPSGSIFNCSVLSFCHLASSLSVRGMVNIPLHASVLQFLHLGSSLSIRSFTRLGSAMSMVDSLNVGSALSLRQICRLSSAVSAFDKDKFEVLNLGGSALSVLSLFERARVGSCVSIMHQLQDVGSSLSVRKTTRLGATMSVLTFCQLGSALSLRQYTRLGSGISIFGADNGVA